MTFDIENRSGVHIVHLHGDLTAGNEGPLVESITNLFTGPGVRILINLHDVPFLDSTGLGGLVRVAAQANIQEGRIVLASPSPFVEGVLQTTQLDHFFRICPTIQDALAALA